MPPIWICQKIYLWKYETLWAIVTSTTDSALPFTCCSHQGLQHPNTKKNVTFTILLITHTCAQVLPHYLMTQHTHLHTYMHARFLLSMHSVSKLLVYTKPCILRYRYLFFFFFKILFLVCLFIEYCLVYFIFFVGSLTIACFLFKILPVNLDLRSIFINKASLPCTCVHSCCLTE